MKKKKPHHDIFLGNSEQWRKAREAQRNEAFAWKVGAFAIIIMTGVFIWALVEML